MWMTIIVAILPIAIRLISLYIDNVQENNDLKKKFIELMELLRKSGAKIGQTKYENERDQVQQGNDEWDKREKESQNPPIS